MTYNTRIAPSPTGHPHLGLMRTAYFNWLAARISGGQFILRIDDTDKKRSKQEYVDSILNAMHFLGLDYDRIEYQSQRQNRYRRMADILVANGLASNDGEAVIAYPQAFPSVWIDDLSGEIQITEDNKRRIAEGVVLIKSDGMPTYHFSCVVDDIDMNINYIIRGVDHITNTATQVAIYDTLGMSIPKYCHVGLLCKKKKPLSKRDGESDFLQYQNQYHPEAILNFLARLGWGPRKDDKTTAVLPKERMLELFLEGGKMKAQPANIDLMKLQSFHRKYIARDRQHQTI